VVSRAGAAVAGAHFSPISCQGHSNSGEGLNTNLDGVAPVSANDAEMVAAAVAGRTLTEIAAAAGASVSTVQRRLRDPDIMERVRQARSQHRQEALGQLTSLRSRALERLHDLLEGDDPALVLGTATLVLSTATKFDRVADLDERVAELEQLVKSTADAVQDREQEDDAVA
jgi:AcrR family transcriptional regulator